MSAQVSVERVFELPGRGPIAVGLLEGGTVSTGDSMLTATGVTVVVLGLEMHVPQPETGQRVGLLLRPQDAPAVTPGSTLTGPPET